MGRYCSWWIKRTCEAVLQLTTSQRRCEAVLERQYKFGASCMSICDSNFNEDDDDSHTPGGAARSHRTLTRQGGHSGGAGGCRAASQRFPCHQYSHSGESTFHFSETTKYGNGESQLKSS